MTSYAELRSRFAAQIKTLQQTAQATGEALQGAGPRPPQTPDKGDWSGDPLALDTLAAAFSRDEHTADVQATIAAQSQGVVGDLVSSALQGDLLACLERSYRCRHASRARRSMHAAARRLGQGHDAGVFLRGAQGAVEGVLKQSKDAVT